MIDLKAELITLHKLADSISTSINEGHWHPTTIKIRQAVELLSKLKSYIEVVQLDKVPSASFTGTLTSASNQSSLTEIAGLEKIIKHYLDMGVAPSQIQIVREFKPHETRTSVELKHSDLSEIEINEQFKSFLSKN